MRSFTLLVGGTSLLIAGCAAYFSVRGIGLLFAGFMIPVMFMAASLEVGKLVAASFLYRRWKKVPLFLKTYLTVAVLTLIAITSLGIYGYLSDAFNKTTTRVAFYNDSITQIEEKNVHIKAQIESINETAETVDDKANEAIQNFQKIYDDFIARQDTRKEALNKRLTALDEARNKMEAEPGGLFSSKKKKLAALTEEQKPEREEMRVIFKQIESENKEEYDSFLAKVDDLRTKTGEVDIRADVDSQYVEIKANEDEILNLKELIGNTDIGSFKFIAKTFNMELEQVVKWFMIIIVVVFDPLAVCLIIGYNSLLTRKEEDHVLSSKKKKAHTPEESAPTPDVEEPASLDDAINTTPNQPAPEEVVTLSKLRAEEPVEEPSTENLPDGAVVTMETQKEIRKRLKNLYQEKGKEGVETVLRDIFKYK